MNDIHIENSGGSLPSYVRTLQPYIHSKNYVIATPKNAPELTLLFLVHPWVCTLYIMYLMIVTLTYFGAEFETEFDVSICFYRS